VHVFFAERLLEDFLGHAREMVAIDGDQPFGADERDSAGSAVDHFHAVGVQVLDALGRFLVAGREDLDRSGVVHIEAPLSDIEVVGAEVGHAAAGVFAVGAPVGAVVVHAAGA